MKEEYVKDDYKFGKGKDPYVEMLDREKRRQRNLKLFFVLIYLLLLVIALFLI